MDCKYCHQPIYETELTAAHIPPNYLQFPCHMRGKYRHIKEDKLDCNKEQIDPNCEKPHCHICGTDDNSHSMFCSASGFPVYYARPKGFVEKQKH